jgi:hypothetical protein
MGASECRGNPPPNALRAKGVQKEEEKEKVKLPLRLVGCRGDVLGEWRCGFTRSWSRRCVGVSGLCPGRFAPSAGLGAVARRILSIAPPGNLTQVVQPVAVTTLAELLS